MKKKIKQSMMVFLLILFFFLNSTIFYENNNITNPKEKKEIECFNNLKSSSYSFALTEIISTESVNTSAEPFIIIDDFENIHLVWKDSTDMDGSEYNDSDIFYKCWDNITKDWTSIELISNGSTDNSFTPSMTLDNLRNVHIVWGDLDNITGINNDNGKTDIYYKHMNYSTGLWSSIDLISTESNQSAANPLIVTDSRDNIHLVWYDYTDLDGLGSNDYDIFYKRWNVTSKTWTIPELISNGSAAPSQNQQITIDKYDNIHVTWEDWTDYDGCGSDHDIFYKQWDNNTKTWTITEVISTESTFDSEDPSITIDSSGNLHIAWEDKTDYNGCGGDPDIFYKQWDNNTKTWTITEVISTESTLSSQYPSIVIDNLENIYIVWTDYTNYDYSGDDWDIFYKQWDNNTKTWMSTSIISTESTENSRDVSIATDDCGNVCVVWSDYTNYDESGDDWDIFYKHLITNDNPIITTTPSTIITNGSVMEKINWVINDQIGGTGIYHIIANDTEDNLYEWIPWTQWDNNTLLSIPINPSEPGIYTYTIEYYDIYHLKGLNSSVIIIINDDLPIIEGPNNHEVHKGSGYLLTWTIIDDFGGISYRFYENGVPKDWHLWPSTDPIPYILDTSVLGTFNITIQYNTTTGQIAFDTILINITRSPMDIFINDYLIYLFILIMVLIGISLYSTFKKNKKEKKVNIWKAKTEVLFDTLNIDSLLIIHKKTSTILLNINYFKRIEQPALIGGFLQAITSFKYVLKDQDIKANLNSKEMFLLDFRDYKILIEDGEFIRIALIINLMPSDYIKDASKNFIEEFEARYYKYLTHFYGEVSVFENSMDLIDKYFNIYLINPHIINPSPPSFQLTNFQEKIYDLAKTFYGAIGHFHITKLLEFLIGKMPQVPRDKIIANISDLIQYGYIKPIGTNT